MNKMRRFNQVAATAAITLLAAIASQSYGIGTASGPRELAHAVKQPVGKAERQREATVEIDRVLTDFHDAAAKADFDRYFSHWTADSVFLGTDATERWTGKEFQEFARPHFKAGKGWTYHPRDRRITMAGDDHAYFDELLGHDKLGLCRGSGVLRRVDGAWKVMQYNLSIPVPNDLAEGVVKTIKEAAKPDPNEPRHKE